MKEEDSTSKPQAGGKPLSPGGQDVSFEAAMKRLGEIVDLLERGELPLNDSLRLFEEGVDLTKRAGEMLGEAQRKVEALTRAADGALGTTSFRAAESEED